MTGAARFDKTQRLKATLAERLADALAASGLTQRALASMTGWASSAVNRYCTGKMLPKLDVVADIADITGVTVDSLLGREGASLADDAAALRARVEAARYTPAALASECSMKPAAMAAVLAGRQELTAREACRVAGALGCSVEELFAAPARKGASAPPAMPPRDALEFDEAGEYLERWLAIPGRERPKAGAQQRVAVPEEVWTAVRRRAAGEATTAERVALAALHARAAGATSGVYDAGPGERTVSHTFTMPRSLKRRLSLRAIDAGRGRAENIVDALASHVGLAR